MKFIFCDDDRFERTAIKAEFIEDAIEEYRVRNEDICRMKGDPVTLLIDRIEIEI